MDAFDRILDLEREGLYCAQIMVQLALDAEGKENPDLVQAVRGLCGGFAWSGGPCGALSGGVCFLSLLARELDAEERIKANITSGSKPARRSTAGRTARTSSAGIRRTC